jgi:hypothetical protein
MKGSDRELAAGKSGRPFVGAALLCGKRGVGVRERPAGRPARKRHHISAFSKQVPGERTDGEHDAVSEGVLLQDRATIGEGDALSHLVKVLPYRDLLRDPPTGLVTGQLGIHPTGRAGYAHGSKQRIMTLGPGRPEWGWGRVGGDSGVTSQNAKD